MSFDRHKGVARFVPTVRMPIQATYDVLNAPARVAGCRFELAARRVTEEWLALGRVQVSAEVLALAIEFLGRCGFVAEGVTGCHVRLLSEAGRPTILSREATVVMALRCLVALDGRYASGLLTRRAA